MASSLVADYDSSDSESVTSEGRSDAQDCAFSRDDAVAKKNANYFATDSDDAGDEERDATSEEKPSQSPSETCSNSRLPNPLLGTADDEDGESRSSVFVNYYHRAEQAKLAVLEQHVKLTASKDPTGNGQKKDTKKRQMCVNFLRGRCRYANKCRFAHSSETTKAETGSAIRSGSNKSSGYETAFGSASLVVPQTQQHFDYTAEEFELNADDDDDELNKKRKKRSGLNDTLVPPKRSLQSLEKQRREERPWTVKRN